MKQAAKGRLDCWIIYQLFVRMEAVEQREVGGKEAQIRFTKSHEDVRMLNAACLQYKNLRQDAEHWFTRQMVLISAFKEETR